MPISIHPLRGEWDPTIDNIDELPTISIHPLRGEWDQLAAAAHGVRLISIHPLRGEWDIPKLATGAVIPPFQSTHSVGSGTCPISNRVPDNRISIHPLRGEWDGAAVTKT